MLALHACLSAAACESASLSVPLPHLALPLDRCSLPPFHLQSPGLSPSRLGCRGQGWALLLVLTGPSWGQERNGQRTHSVPAPLNSSCLTKLTAARSSPGFTSWPAHSPFCCPNPLWLRGPSWGWGRQRQEERWGRERDRTERQEWRVEEN